MSNSWFQFRKFIIRQDRTAMKVGTDGVLLGAWAEISECSQILDIGTGTGLIALMLAQRCDAEIDAIEIDEDAARQAAENVLGSPWAGRINIIHSTFQDFYKTSWSKFDMVVCNPPFFTDSLKPVKGSRSLARHDDLLNREELFSGVVKILKRSGHFCLILPSDRESGVLACARENNLFPSEILRIRPNPGKEFKRVLIKFTFSEQEPVVSEMCIETGNRHVYSSEYVELTREFYLGERT